MFKISTTKRLIPVTEKLGSVSRTVFIDPAYIDSIFQQLDNAKLTDSWVLYTSAGRSVVLTGEEFRRLYDLMAGIVLVPQGHMDGRTPDVGEGCE